jgi:hypothetical protein
MRGSRCGCGITRRCVVVSCRCFMEVGRLLPGVSRFRVLLENLVQLSLPHFPIPHTYIDLTLQYLIQPQFNPSISRTCALFTHRDKGRLPGPPFYVFDVCIVLCFAYGGWGIPRPHGACSGLGVVGNKFGVPLMCASCDADTNIGQWEQSLTGPITGGAFP